MLCVWRLLPRGLVAAAQLHGLLESALPVLLSCLDDENAETRGLSCATLSHVLRQVTPTRTATPTPAPTPTPTPTPTLTPT